MNQICTVSPPEHASHHGCTDSAARQRTTAVYLRDGHVIVLAPPGCASVLGAAQARGLDHRLLDAAAELERQHRSYRTSAEVTALPVHR